MSMRFGSSLTGMFVAGMLTCGCAKLGLRHELQKQQGESVVLAGETASQLRFDPVLSQPISVRSTYRDGLPKTTHYEPGHDYALNASGEIRRLPGSRIPDFGTNILFGREDFQHGNFPGFGNNGFFVYVDYATRDPWLRPVARLELGATQLPKSRHKLEAGQPLRVIAFGDSITAGGEASEPALIFWERWAQHLRDEYPKAQVEAINGATGGDTTVQGLQRLPEKVLRQKPDLVLIGFGMNDHNREGYGVKLEDFKANLRSMIRQIRSVTGAEIVLYSTFPPNPKWHYGSHNMQAYANATEQVAREEQCAFADVYGYWLSLSARKKPEDLLANNINHPNDYGHWIYLQALLALGL